MFSNWKDAAVISVLCAARSCSAYYQHTIAAINDNATLYIYLFHFCLTLATLCSDVVLLCATPGNLVLSTSGFQFFLYRNPGP